MPEWLIAVWGWLQASDPGLSRLRLAGSAAIAMASALAVELVFARLMQVDYGHTVIAMILGALVAMLGSMALLATLGGVRSKSLTAVFFPVAIGAGMFLGVAVSGRTDVMLAMFVVVMFAAVYVRRFGISFFFYGFMFWLGYFFASFLNAKLAVMPFYLAAVALGSAWVLLLSVTVLRVNPARALQRSVTAFDARARDVTRACAELLQSTAARDSRAQRRLQHRIQGQERRLAEAALIVEGWAVEPAALAAGQSAATLRRQLIGAQQALDTLIVTSRALAKTDSGWRQTVAQIAWRLTYRDDVAAARRARKLKTDSAPRHSKPGQSAADSQARRSAYRFAKATVVFVSLARSARHRRASHTVAGANTAPAFEPTAGLIMGNLPGSPAVARGLSARGARWNPLARLDLTSRQAIQVALAGGLAIVAGRALSPTRYYWAVIAAFVMFSGTATRSETFLKGLYRVIGTALGLTAAVGLAEFTAGHPLAIVATIIGSMFCGFYLLRVNYAYMIFFVTIMVAQLYTILHEFTPGLLVLRLEETAIGAGIGFAVALLLMPLSTRDTARSARQAVLEAVAELLRQTAARLQSPMNATNNAINNATMTADMDAAMNSAAGEANSAADEPIDAASLYAQSRTLDDAIRRFALVSQPLTLPLLGGSKHLLARHRLSRYIAMATTARALIVAVNDLTAAADNASNIKQIMASRALATAAQQLAGLTPGQAEAIVATPLATAEQALARCDPERLHGEASDHLNAALRRMHFLLKSLATAG